MKRLLVPAVLGLATAAAVLALVLKMPGRRAELAEAGVSNVKPDEVVVFYPTFARLDADGKSWTLPIHGCVFEPESDSLKRAVLATAVRRSLGLKLDADQKRTFETRLRPFLLDHQRGKTISIRIGSQTHQVGASGPNGHFSGEVRLPAASVEQLAQSGQVEDGWLLFRAAAGPSESRSGRVLLAAPTGLSVISDVDDTIKITEVLDRSKMLANTFARPFRAVPGMPELYRRLAAGPRQPATGGRAAGATFHYVSGSPWQLYEPLRDFCRNERFPQGTFHLKYFRLTDSSVLNLFGSQEGYKTPVIEELLAALPGRRFVLIGDSGEQDPEVYGAIARKHPGQVAAIFIRNVTGEQPGAERFRKAFEGIAAQGWKLFDQPAELDPLVSKLVVLRP
jgi:hypothetical protein